MGMFDSLYVTCPECGEEVEFQSKAGECMLEHYTLSDAPDIILIDLNGKVEECLKCGNFIRINSKTFGYIS